MSKGISGDLRNELEIAAAKRRISAVLWLFQGIPVVPVRNRPSMKSR
jgi:hypothetical protein